MRYDDLTRRQRDVLDAREPVVLVLGGPGSGKTTTALWTARVALDELGGDARVIFLTFSRTAVAQIAKSAPGVLEACRGRIEISTFHGLAWRIVRAFGRYGGQGQLPPAVQSDARVRLLGRDGSQMG